MRIVFFCSFLLFTVVARAQFTKGDVSLGGTLSTSIQNGVIVDTDYKQSSFSLLPRVGILMSGKFALGGQLGFSYGNQQYGTDTGDYISKSYFAGIFGEQFFTISDKVLFSLVGSLSYSRSKNSTPYFNILTGQIEVEEDKAYQFRLAVEPSFLFFPSPHWSVGVGLGSLNYTFGHSVTDDSSSNNFSMNYGSFLVSATYYFRRNTE